MTTIGMTAITTSRLCTAPTPPAVGTTTATICPIPTTGTLLVAIGLATRDIGQSCSV